MKTETQLALPIVPKIPSALGPRKVALTSLRPGDWLRMSLSETETSDYVVMKNSAAKERLEVRFEFGTCESYSYTAFYVDTYLGHGTRRAWWPLLPKWAQKWVAPYSRP